MSEKRKKWLEKKVGCGSFPDCPDEKNWRNKNIRECRICPFLKLEEEEEQNEE